MARIVVLLVLLSAVGAAAAAWAGGSKTAADPIQRTFVSTSGLDTNPCTRAEPCRNFVAALPNTLPGGEVVALDSGGYGPITIDKAVTLAGAPGVHAAITAFSGNAITVSAGETDTVVLRNLYLTGLGGDNGIRFFTGGALHVEGVTVTGFTNRGIRVTCDADAAVEVVVRDSVFRHNNGGVIMNGTACDLRFQIERTRADSNSLHGFWFLGPVDGSVARSTASGNAGSGYFFQPEAVVTLSDSRAEGNFAGISVQEPGAGVVVTAERVVLSNNGAGTGVVVTTGALVRLSSSTVTGQHFGLWNFDGTLETFGDNIVRGNDQNVVGTTTSVGKT